MRRLWTVFVSLTLRLLAVNEVGAESAVVFRMRGWSLLWESGEDIAPVLLLQLQPLACSGFDVGQNTSEKKFFFFSRYRRKKNITANSRMSCCWEKKRNPGLHCFLKLSKVMVSRRETDRSRSSGERVSGGWEAVLCSCLCGHNNLTAALSTRAPRGHAAKKWNK